MTAAELPPGISTDLRRLADAELSLPSRLGHVALLLGAITMTIIVSSLWLTEAQLPVRTRIAFAVMIVIGLSWTAFAVWVLTHRRILLARHRIIAGRLAVTFTAVFALGALGVGVATGRPEALSAAGLGTMMLVAAVALLIRAHREFSRLVSRRDALAREIGR